MAENLMNSANKATNQAYRDGYGQIFQHEEQMWSCACGWMGREDFVNEHGLHASKCPYCYRPLNIRYVNKDF